MPRLTLILLLTIRFAVGQSVEAPKKIRLEGSIVTLNGDAISKATLRLLPTVPPRGGLAPPPPPTFITATSADDGKFVFEDVPPGTYLFAAERTGFVSQRYGAAQGVNTGGTQLTLEPGQTVKDLLIKLAPAAIVNGRVLDRDGDPVAGLAVTFSKFNYVRGRRTLTAGGRATSDDRGSYRVANLAPGRYYVSVEDPRAQFAALGVVQEQAGRPGPREIFVTTYYPNDLDLQSAKPIDLKEGSEIQGFDLRARKERVYSVRARAVDANGASVQGSALSIRTKDDSVFASGIASVANPVKSEDGAFQFRDLLPGNYVVQTSTVAPGTPAPMVGRKEVNLTSGDLDGVLVILTPAADLTGVLRLEDGDPKTVLAPEARPVVGLSEYVIPGYNNRAGRLDDSGTFRIASVFPAIYNVNVSGLPEGVYLKSVRFGGKDVTRAPLDLTGGGGGALDVLLSSKAAEVAGVLRDGDSLMRGVLVALWPKGSQTWDSVGGVKTINSDQKGAFRFGNLPPGEYFLAAWRDVDSGLVENTDFRLRFNSEASEITVVEGLHLQAEARMIPREKIAAEIAKLP